MGPLSPVERRVHDLWQRHAVVLHADIADYSRLMADDPSATVATVRDYHRLVASAVTAAGGTMANFVGDSFMAVFDDARGAMRAAVSICGAVRERNRSLPRTRRMYFRLGLDAGEIVVASDGSHFGEPLNIAARVQAIAQVGGINVTEAVFRELDEPALRLTGLGPRRLKNIPEPVRVYRLNGIVGDDDDRPRSDATAPSVAIMPAHSSQDPVDRDIATAVRLDLVRALVRIPGLRVIDGHVGDDGPASRARVAARYFLQSGVVRSGIRVRAYVDLDETDTMNRVWSERWDGTTDDVFALQDRVTADTVRAMEIELVVGEPATIYRATLDADALDAVYRGWYQLTLGTRTGWRSAVELFTSVASTRPRKPTGHALTAFARWYGAAQGLSDDPADDLEQATAYATRGIELDDDTGLSHLVVAAARLHAGDDLDSALAATQDAVVRRPTCDVSFALEGSVRRYLGQWHEAVDACLRALELSPLPKSWYQTVLASAYYVGERYHDAVDAAECALELRPHNAEALLVLIASQQALGLERRARASAAMLLDRVPKVQRAELARHHPFRDPTILERWTAHLAAAGVP
jgi:adenylate cyclase